MEDRRETKTSHEELRNEKSQKRKEEDRCKNKTGLTTKYDRVGQWSVMVEQLIGNSRHSYRLVQHLVDYLVDLTF